MATIIRYSHGATRVCNTREEADASLLLMWPEYVAHDCDGEPGRVLVWRNAGEMHSDNTGGGRAVAEMNTQDD